MDLSWLVVNGVMARYFFSKIIMLWFTVLIIFCLSQLSTVEILICLKTLIVRKGAGDVRESMVSIFISIISQRICVTMGWFEGELLVSGRF